MTIGWSGYPNGQIPLALMTQLSPILGVGGYAQPDAANAFLRMAKDFEAAVGLPLKFSEFYRPITVQEELFTDRYVRTSVNTGIYWQGSYWAKKPGVAAAAVPGTSNHGYAIAVDFAWPLTSWTTEGQAWFRANEARYGFSSAQGVADGEPWHKVYVGPTTTTSGGGAIDIPVTRKELDSMRVFSNIDEGGQAYLFTDINYSVISDPNLATNLSLAIEGTASAPKMYGAAMNSLKAMCDANRRQLVSDVAKALGK